MTGFAGIRVAADVVERARGGDESAFSAIYRALSPAVYTLALRLVSNRAKAEDVLQDTFIEVLRSIGAYRGDAALATWVRRIAVSKALMVLRSAWEQRGRSLESAPEARAAAPETPEMALDLSAALARLPARSRVVVWLHDVEGYTHDEIATLTGTTRSFSKSRLSRARAELRAHLGEQPPLPASTPVTESC